MAKQSTKQNSSSFTKTHNVYFVIGEVSGDTLGVELLDGFKACGANVNPMGLGGTKMQARGLNSTIDVSDIAVMGLANVVAKLPKLLKLARKVADDIVAKEPDVIVLIDSPEFAKQIAKRVKKKLPNTPIIKYVCPSVWAWREHRAKKMTAYIDHILAILPFEPELLKKLEGPSATYVGHPLARLAGKVKASSKKKPNTKPNVLLMPGSRQGELARMFPVLKQTVELLEERGNDLNYIIPAVSHLKENIEQEIATRPHSISKRVKIIEGEKAKLKAFEKADLAIATSGTAILELAMHMIPCISIYKLDKALNAIRFIIKAWTAALPNLIADKIIVPERINEYAHPQYIARLAEGLLVEGHERNAQLKGFELVHKNMSQKQDPASIAAKAILKFL
ncbi:MAG: lipid-A-disaccharide synthase [Nitratireductor sp.]